MKMIAVVGARPQFVKGAPVVLELPLEHRKVLLYTQQHDHDVLRVFLHEFDMPEEVNRVPVNHISDSGGIQKEARWFAVLHRISRNGRVVWDSGCRLESASG
mgnify:CR=1 FL=1